jgi:hypothetical protein
LAAQCPVPMRPSSGENKILGVHLPIKIGIPSGLSWSVQRIASLMDSDLEFVAVDMPQAPTSIAKASKRVGDILRRQDDEFVEQTPGPSLIVSPRRTPSWLARGRFLLAGRV